MAKRIVGRNFACIGYPGKSLPEDYRKKLNNLHLQWAESPIHDSDLNADETEKGDHIHFFFKFDGQKSIDNVNEFIQPIVCGSPCIVIQNPVGYLRYFIHLDNPEKHQYERDDIRTYGGLDIDDYFKSPRYMIRNKTKEILSLCRILGIVELCDLYDYAKDNDRDDILDILQTPDLIPAYLRSLRFKMRDEQRESDTVNYYKNQVNELRKILDKRND